MKVKVDNKNNRSIAPQKVKDHTVWHHAIPTQLLQLDTDYDQTISVTSYSRSPIPNKI